MSILVFLAIQMFSIGCNVFVMAGLLPDIAQTIGQSIAVTGQGIALFSLAYLISAPLSSLMFTNRTAKHVLQIALIIFICGNFITLFANNLTLFLIGRLCAGVGAGIFTPLCVSTALVFAGPLTSGRILSLVWGANSLGVVLGVPFALHLCALFSWQCAISFITLLSLFSLMGLSLLQNECLNQFQPFNIPLNLSSLFNLLLNKKTLSILSITCFTAMASLGLYSYLAAIHVGAYHSITLTFFAWGFGAFVGSSVVGVLLDRIKIPELVMALILLGLMSTFVTMPLTKNLAYLELVPFFMWGVFGWATIAPQQRILFELSINNNTSLIALNASALGLGTALGTAIYGVIIHYGIKEIYLSYLAAALILIVLMCQLFLIRTSKGVVYE